MSLLQLLSDLRREGISAVLEQERGLVFRGNLRALTDYQRTTIKARKAEVAAILRLEAGCPDPSDVALWRGIYAEVGTWSVTMQRLYFDRAEYLAHRLGSPEAAETEAFRELHQAAIAPSPATFLRERHGIEVEDFTALCRDAIGRPAPSTAQEDARVAGEILRAHWRQV